MKVCDESGGCFVSDVKAGVEYAAANITFGDVANISLGYPEDCFTDDTPPEFDHCDIALSSMENSIINAANAGLKFTIAAGNESQDANNVSPARVEHSNVWSVSAFDINDQFASFSNYGNPPIEYGEPGVDVPSLWKNGGTNTISGTSMAAPHLAGLLLAAPLGITSDGTVSGDPDGDPDPIGVASTTPPPLTVYFTSGPQTVQTGDLVSYTASASGGTPPYYYHFTWHYTNGGLSPAPQTPNAYESNPYQFVVPNQTGTILLKVDVTGSNGATGTDQLQIFVFGVG